LSIQQVSTTTRDNTFDAPAQIVFDEAETNVVSSTVSALVSKWVKSPGESVKRGDVLAILQSAEIAGLESELIKSQAAFKVQNKELIRHKELLAKSLISTSDYDQIEAQTEQALANFTSAKGMLLSVGLNDADIENLIETKTVSNNFVLRSQSDGMLVERIAKLGELLEAGSAFAMLANPKYMWVEAQLTEQQLRNVENGQMIKYTSDGRGINQVGAEIIWVSRFLDQHTRTGTVRAKIIDPSAKLQAGEFGIVTIIKNYNEPTFLVPKDAVQWEGCCNVVFVKESDLRFRPHKVNLIGRMGEYYQVSDGVSGGDQVVVDGSFLLKTELMKSSIGAGCCGLEPVG
ncbi:MAG: efflux RND transporter periplasmic adaptor subunit, partial [bacterium]